MHFITEVIWQALPHEGEALMVASWPTADAALYFPEEEAEMERVMAAIKAVRALRAEKNVPPSKKTSMTIETAHPDSYRDGEAFLKRLASAGEVHITTEPVKDAGGCAVATTEDARVYLPLAELVDVEKELARIAKELKKAEGQAAGMKAKLSNEAFLSKAPEQVVAAEREKARKLDALVENLRESEAKLRALR